jgi:hypothetical protein
MSFITHRRGRLVKYWGAFDESLLLQEVTLDEYLALQYPPYLLEQFPEQAQADRYRERIGIQMATLPGDTFWLWHRVDCGDMVDEAPFECGGLALRRAGKVVCVWLVWEGH